MRFGICELEPPILRAASNYGRLEFLAPRRGTSSRRALDVGDADVRGGDAECARAADALRALASVLGERGCELLAPLGDVTRDERERRVGDGGVHVSGERVAEQQPVERDP